MIYPVLHRPTSELSQVVSRRLHFRFLKDLSAILAVTLLGILDFSPCAEPSGTRRGCGVLQTFNRANGGKFREPRGAWAVQTLRYLSRALSDAVQ